MKGDGSIELKRWLSSRSSDRSGCCGRCSWAYCSRNAFRSLRVDWRPLRGGCDLSPWRPAPERSTLAARRGSQPVRCAHATGVATSRAPVKTLTLTTRRSPLALAQAKLVAVRLAETGTAGCTLLPLVSTGDRQIVWSPEKRGGRGLSTAELEEALPCGDADLAVHSAKDLPGDMPAGVRSRRRERSSEASALSRPGRRRGGRASRRYACPAA
jgi:hypothetical protein